MQPTAVQAAVTREAATADTVAGDKTTGGEFKSLLSHLLEQDDAGTAGTAEELLLAILMPLLQQEGLLSDLHSEQLSQLATGSLESNSLQARLAALFEGPEVRQQQMFRLLANKPGSAQQLQGLLTTLQSSALTNNNEEVDGGETKALLEKLLSLINSRDFNQQHGLEAKRTVLGKSTNMGTQLGNEKKQGFEIKQIITVPPEGRNAITVAAAQPKQEFLSDFQQLQQTFANNIQQQAVSFKEDATARSPLNFDNILQQLAAKVRLTALQGKSEAYLQLKPEYLGKVQLQLTVLNDGMMTAKFAVENHQVAHALQQQIPQLRQDLQGQGLELQQASVEVGDNTARHQFDEQLQQQGKQKKMPDNLQAADEDVPTEILNLGRLTVDLLA